MAHGAARESSLRVLSLALGLSLGASGSAGVLLGLDVKRRGHASAEQDIGVEHA